MTPCAKRVENLKEKYHDVGEMSDIAPLQMKNIANCSNFISLVCDILHMKI